MDWTMIRSHHSRIGGAVCAGMLSLAVGAAAANYTWSELQPAGDTNAYWDSVALSSDGQTLIAGNNDGRLYTSANRGAMWQERQPAGNSNRFWSAVATSGDGRTMVAASTWVSDFPLVPGRLYASANAGTSWTEQQPAGATDLEWTSLACSADGLTVLAGTAGTSGGGLYILRGGIGGTWQEVQPAGPTNVLWETLTASGDGSVLLAGAYGGRLYLSRDNGVGWSEIQPVGVLDRWWQASALSAFGQHIYAATGLEPGRIHSSSDGGLTWTERQPAGDADYDWSALGCSGDGRSVVAVAAGGRAFVSADAGQTWTETQPAGATNYPWWAAAASVDARHVVMAGSPGRIYSGVVTSGVSRLFYEASDSNGVYQIYTCQADVSGEIKLFDDTNNRYRPVVSADGQKLAYLLNDGSLSWVCTSDISGANEQYLVSTDTDFGYRSVNWHPDGLHLIYVMATYNGSTFEPSPARDGHLYRYDINGSNVTELLPSDYDYDKHYAAYSPDGRMICLGRNEATWYAWPQNLFLCDADGFNLVKRTAHPNGEQNKVFTCRYSPSGSRIVYQRGYSNAGNSSLWSIRSDGSYQANIVDATFSNEGPAFARDGRHVFFSRYMDSRWQLARCDPDGSNVQILPLSADLNRRQPCEAVVESFPPIVGRVRCDITPARAVQRGARWRLSSGLDTAWHDSGESSAWLDPASNPYTVLFDYVSDYYTPDSIGVTVGSNATTTVQGDYTPDDMAYIEASPFSMGLYLGQGGHDVTLDDYLIDTREVTVTDYEAFCTDTGHSMPPPPPWGWGDTNLPIVNVTWNDAAAFAAWAGKRLPTEAEFEFAMRSGESGWIYPWGDTISSEDANYDEADIGQPTQAGTFGYNLYYLYDMAGNVNEWCYDWYQDILTGPATNPVGPASGTYKTTRSGSYVNRERQLRCSSRIFRAPSVRYIDLGFRCAADVSTYGEQTGYGPQFSAAPTWWVLSHFGLAVGGPDGSFDGEKDSDGDGISDGAEYVAGTDPTNRTSVLSIKRMTALSDGSGCVVEWSSEPGKVYTLEHCPSLAERYRPVAGNLLATPPLNGYTVRGDQAAAGFYRVRVPQ